MGGLSSFFIVAKKEMKAPNFYQLGACGGNHPRKHPILGQNWVLFSRNLELFGTVDHQGEGLQNFSSSNPSLILDYSASVIRNQTSNKLRLYKIVQLDYFVLGEYRPGAV